MTSLTPNIIRARLGQLASHVLVALIALVAIGGATRVMEAGLACPDWPLCYGSIFPKGKMNVQVFLEWFHRLDACFVGIAIAVQFLLSLIYRSYVSNRLLWLNFMILSLVILQGSFGALTVINLLPSFVVMGHLFLALTLVALVSGLSQSLLSPNGTDPPFWWKFLARGSLLMVFMQCLLGSRLATTWSAQKCISNGVDCGWLNLHSFSALPVVLSICLLSFVSISMGGWFRSQWPFFLILLGLVVLQIGLGSLAVFLALSEPLVIVCHQLIASLLVAFLSALSVRKVTHSSSIAPHLVDETSLKICHG
ncbi:COX15/CtaA family protein [Prochlorococcus marinus]|uniref:COX15/CtaA family protein n=1 Tax=Prochlorococcus marinus TaxID=1219 RepID=UPI0022B56F61|nr:COX15/CtaA family protein [Prochlorococcus marinus]